MARKFLKTIVLLMAALALIAAGCGDDGDDTGGEGQTCKDDGSCNSGLLCTTANTCTGAVELSSYAAEASASYCAWIYKCCQDAEISEYAAAIGETIDSEASCQSVFTDLLGTYFVTPAQAAVDAGRGTYNAGTSAACLVSGATAACTGAGGGDGFSQLMQSCNGSYAGTQAVDAECAKTLECTPGLQCVSSVCLAPLVLDDTCATAAGSHACGEGLYCDPLGLTCLQRKAANAACTGGSALECVAGYTCDEDDTLTCIELVSDSCTGR